MLLVRASSPSPSPLLGRKMHEKSRIPGKKKEKERKKKGEKQKKVKVKPRVLSKYLADTRSIISMREKGSEYRRFLGSRRCQVYVVIGKADERARIETCPRSIHPRASIFARIFTGRTTSDVTFQNDTIVSCLF